MTRWSRPCQPFHHRLATSRLRILFLLAGTGLLLVHFQGLSCNRALTSRDADNGNVIHSRMLNKLASSGEDGNDSYPSGNDPVVSPRDPAASLAAPTRASQPQRTTTPPAALLRGVGGTTSKTGNLSSSSQGFAQNSSERTLPLKDAGSPASESTSRPALFAATIAPSTLSPSMVSPSKINAQSTSTPPLPTDPSGTLVSVGSGQVQVYSMAYEKISLSEALGAPFLVEEEDDDYVSEPASLTRNSSRESAKAFFTKEETGQAIIHNRALKTKFQTTAVLIHWKRTENIKTIVSYLLDYSVVSEVIIWNNNPNVTLTKEYFRNVSLTAASKEIVIVNSRYNFGTRGRYLAAAMASNPTVFLQDDDWDTRGYFWGLFLGYAASPSQVHVATDAPTAADDYKWSFSNHTINLHSGFAWIGCGCFVSKAHLDRFRIIATGYNSGPNIELHMDAMFTIMLNQFPVIYTVQLQELGGEEERAVAIYRSGNNVQNEIGAVKNFAARSVFDSLMKQYQDARKATIASRGEGSRLPLTSNGSIYNNAENATTFSLAEQRTPNRTTQDTDDPSSEFENLTASNKVNAADVILSLSVAQPLNKNWPQRWWSTCPDGSCRFETNIAQVDISTPQYDPTRANYEPVARELFNQQIGHFKRFPIPCAVGGGDCCWKSFYPLKLGNFIGYDFISIGKLSSVVIKHRLPRELTSQVTVSVSLDGMAYRDLDPSNYYWATTYTNLTTAEESESGLDNNLVAVTRLNFQEERSSSSSDSDSTLRAHAAEDIEPFVITRFLRLTFIGEDWKTKDGTTTMNGYDEALEEGITVRPGSTSSSRHLEICGLQRGFQPLVPM